MFTSSKKVHFWREFIHLYRDLPILWNTNCEQYRNRELRDAAYRTLTEKLREIDSEADTYATKRKINSFRSNYNRELKKVQITQGNSDVYVPMVWYFDEMKFLDACEQTSNLSPFANRAETPKAIEQNVEVKLEHAWDDDEMHDEEFESSPPSSFSPYPPKKRIKTFQKIQTRPDDLEHHESTSETEILSRVWAMEFDKLTSDQQLFAKKAIDDILFEARLKTLNRDSVKINHQCPCSVIKNEQMILSSSSLIEEQDGQLSPSKLDR